MADILSEGFLKAPWIGRRVSMLLCRAIFSVGVLAVCAGRVNAFELAPYLESPPNDKPQGKVGISFQDGGQRLRAGLNVEGKDGQTTVRPQLTSSFAIGEEAMLLCMCRPRCLPSTCPLPADPNHTAQRLALGENRLKQPQHCRERGQ